MHRVVVVIVLAALVLAACDEGSPDSADTPEATPTSATTSLPASSEPTSDPEPTVSSEPVALDLPRSVVYAGLEATVENVAVSNATPGTYLDDDPEPGEDRYAYVDVHFDWETGYPGGTTQIETDWFSLALADGAVVPSSRVDFRGSYQLREGQPVDATLAFAVEDAAEVADAAIRIQETGHVPAVLDLGAAPDGAATFPVALDVAGEANVSIEGGCGDGEATTTLTGGEADVDAGVDADGEPIMLSGSARAESGSVVVRLAFRTVALSGTCGGAIATDDQYRLVVDGLPTAPINRAVEGLDAGTGVELVFGWMVPLDAELEVVVGTVEGTTATFPVPLPEIDLPA